jgi:NitT/TauT family transport system substrate-binding protein
MSSTVMSRARATALVAAGAVISATKSPGRAQAKATIRIAITPVENSSQPYYASDMGFFARAGLGADIQAMPNSPAIGAAIASGAVDVGSINIDALATAHAKGVPLTIVAPASEHRFGEHTNVLIVAASSSIQRAKDLGGKIIGCSALHSLSQTAPCVWMDQNGGDSSTVKFVEVPFSAMPTAVESGRVDAANVAEPFVNAARKNGRILADCFDAIAKRFLIVGWVATPQWVQDHPDLAQRFAAAMHDAAVWANKNPDKSAAILAKYTKIDPTVIAAMTRTRYAEELSPALIQPLIDASAKYNGWKAFPAADLIAGARAS